MKYVERSAVCTVTHMGAEGEGCAVMEEGGSKAGSVVSVPFVLPQEEAEIMLLPPLNKVMRGELLRLKRSSPWRQKAACRHFGICGGCLLQHWQDKPYRQWKHDLLPQALLQAGIQKTAWEGRINPLFSVAAAMRRRIILSVSMAGGRALIGFNRIRSHNIVPLEQCVVAEPALIALLPVIRHMAALLRVRRKNFHIAVTALENGFDIALQGISPIAEEEKLRLAHFLQKKADKNSVETAKILRLTADDEIILEKAKPFLHFGRVKVEVPFGRFLQAAQPAEQFMGDLAAQALRKCKNAADLFAGSGSFTFRLAENSNIHAVEYDSMALAALQRAAAAAYSIQAARAVTGEKSAAEETNGRKTDFSLKKITSERRDLFRQPLTLRELAAYDGLIFDPPRAGAEAQARLIAKAQIKTVVAVSCNPVTLARDMRILLQGGYELQSLTPIDQFLWSPHMEAVAVLTKRPAKKSWAL